MSLANQQENLKVVAYARVSTLLGQDPKLQLLTIREYCKSRNYQIVEEYTDLGISGSIENRPALAKMMTDVRQKRTSIVIVTGLDRISRSTKHFLTLFEELQQNKVGLISLREQLDFTTPTGILVATILASVAQLEKSLISERIKVALAAKKIFATQSGSGWRCGRKPIPSEIQDQVKLLRIKGLSIRAIAIELKIGKTTVERILK